MDNPLQYHVPAGFGEALLTEKRSRFIAGVWPVETEEQALTRLAAVREQYWDANHNVYAYLLKSNGAMRYSDDGEPQGTSGMPVLNVFQNAGVWNVCCVVTRYFGGTLLGSGGLVRAYSKAASLALQNAGLAIMREWRLLEIKCTYSIYERVKGLLENYGAVIENVSFGESVALEVLTPHNIYEKLVEGIKNLSAGQAMLTPGALIHKSVPLSV